MARSETPQEGLKSTSCNDDRHMRWPECAHIVGTEYAVDRPDRATAMKKAVAAAQGGGAFSSSPGIVIARATIAAPSILVIISLHEAAHLLAGRMARVAWTRWLSPGAIGMAALIPFGFIGAGSDHASIWPLMIPPLAAAALFAARNVSSVSRIACLAR